MKLRRIALYVISVANNPIVLVENEPVADFSINGPLTHKRMSNMSQFQIKDRGIPIVGFTQKPDNMWFSEPYRELADYCASMGWLVITRA